jgi:hypothetical protein
VTLAEALGVIPWLKIGEDSVVTEYMQASDSSSATNHAEYWCMADGLEHFWEDETDARWHLLLAILKSIGHSLETIMPLDSADDYTGGWVFSFGIVNDFAICLPSLDAMLNDGLLKKQAWRTLCTNRAAFH